jgi:hypothetical protein
MKRYFILIAAILFAALPASTVFAQNVAINTDGSNADASAILDVKSNNKGMLVPRMNTAQRTGIGSPAPGLLVYDTDNNSFWFYNSVSWTQLTTGGASLWAANGNHITNTNVGRVGIGTTTPNARLTVDSGIVVDQQNVNTGNLTSALAFGSAGQAGISSSFLSGSTTRSGLGFHVKGSRVMVLDSTGQLGIGTINPLQSLHVVGNSYISGNLGVGISSPSTKLDVQGNSLLDGTLTVTSTTNLNNTLNVNSNAVIDGALTVNNGKGVAYNSSSSTNLKIAPFTTGTFVAILNGHQLSAEGSFALPAGFTNTPRVFVGDIDVTGGSAGELYRVQLVVYGCTTTSCKARLLNTSPNPVNYSITWNCVAIGN